MYIQGMKRLNTFLLTSAAISAFTLAGYNNTHANTCSPTSTTNADNITCTGNITSGLYTNSGNDTVTNNATITTNAGTTLHMGSGDTNLINNGILHQDSAADIYTTRLSGAASIDNNGTIQNDNTSGRADALLVHGFGDISGEDIVINNNANGSIQNSSAISTASAIQISTGSVDDIYINNDGVIDGAGYGAYIAADTHADNVIITNNGTINGGRYAILSNNPNNNESVTNNGIINGTTWLADSNDTLTNSGTINGYINMGEGDDILSTSGQIDLVNYMANGDHGIDRFILDGVTTSGAAANVVNFEYIEFINNSNVTLTGNSSFTNDVTIQVGSALAVDNITTTNLINNGNLSSASGGDIVVTGNLASSSGSTINLVLNSDNASTSTALNVSGTTNIDAGTTINISNASGANSNNFAAGQTYNVVVTGSLTDTGAVINTPTLPSGLEWDTNTSSSGIQLVINPNSASGCTGSNLAACNALTNANIFTPTLFSVLSGSIAPSATLNQLTPQGYLAIAQTQSQANQNFTNTIRDRIGILRAMQESATDKNCGIWSKYNGNVNEADNYKSRNHGGSAGGYCKVDSNWIVGAALGYSSGKVEHDLELDADIKSYQAAMHATYRTPTYYFESIINYALTQNDVARQANTNIATADYNSHTIGAQIEGGYNIKYNQLTISPWAALAYENIASDSITEQNAGTLNLTIDEADKDSLNTKIGISANGVIPIRTQDTKILPQIRAYYQHELLDQDNSLNYQLTGANSSVTDNDQPKSKLVIGVGFTTHITSDGNAENVHNIYGNYDHEIGLDEDTHNHRFSLGYKLKF